MNEELEQDLPDEDDLGPTPALRSLTARRLPLADPVAQLRRLGEAHPAADFGATVEAAGLRLHAGRVGVFQINVGKLCNMTCRHCHVDAGPDRHVENMDRETIDACLRALDRTSAHTVDLTGGAPELNPHFRYLVDACTERGKHVIDRCNLTILLLPRMTGLIEFLAERGVEVVASLPHHRRSGTDAQRGAGVFDRSIEALRRLNAAGYGSGDPRRRLTLVHNPPGAFLPSAQAGLERDWRVALERDHGVRFDRLIALNNMPISRFLEWLDLSGNTEAYLQKLVDAFNPGAVAGLMCRDTLSVGWDGRLYDCDFNQMLAMGIDAERPHVQHYAPTTHDGRPIRTDRHCFGCTAGAGSSCGGATT